MFWYFLLALVAVIGLLQLGALSVWVVVLKTLLLVVLAVAFLVGLFLAWKHFGKRH